MHKIVKEFIENDGANFDTPREHFDITNPLEKAYVELIQLNTQEVPKSDWFESADAALLKGHEDLDLLVMYIARYIGYCDDCGQKERVCSIYKMSQSIDIDKCHILVQMNYKIYSTSYLNVVGRQAEAEEILIQILEEMLQNNIRSLRLMGSIAKYFLFIGKLTEIDGKYISLSDFKEQKFQTFAYTTYLLHNSYVTGNLEDTQMHWDFFRNNYMLDHNHLLHYYEDATKLLFLDFTVSTYKKEHFKKIAEAYSELLKGNLDQAEKAYQEKGECETYGGAHERLIKFIPLHVYLNQKSLGKARLALSDISKENDYITDFFQMRLALLENENKKALQYYQRLMANIRRYKASGRVIFEMRFAHELKNYDLFALLEGDTTNHKPSLKKSHRFDLIEKKQTDTTDTSMVGQSEAIQKVRILIEQYANLKETVYVHGETGTGKELVARALHEKSHMKKEPFLAINCGALTDSLLESELFGHEIGAFTGAHKARAGIFESAGKGTVFLDEFGDISHRLQIALLRVLENNEIRPLGASLTKKIHCRIIVSSNNDLVTAVKEKKFREDLYYRVNRFDIYLPPLRERREDIPLLASHYLNLDIDETKKMLLSDNLVNALSQYNWPGNIRELRNEIERCKIMNKGKHIIEMTDFDFSRLSNINKVGEEESMTEQNVTRSPSATMKKDPKIISDSDQSDIDFTSVVSDRIQKIVSHLNKTDQRLDFIHRLFQEHKKLTRAQIMKILHISQSTASKDLETLIEKGLIKREMPTKSSRSYFFTLKPSP